MLKKLLKRFYYFVLLRLGILFDTLPFKPINYLIASAYCFFLPKFLELYLGIPSLKVFPRHSAQSKFHFNPFFSDFDVGIEISDDFNLDTSNILEKYYLFKKIFPALGELEIYSDRSLASKKLLLDKWHTAYNLMRAFRKILWMEQEIAKSKTAYHKYKARRALSNCVKNIGLSVCLQDSRNYLKSLELARHMLDKMLPQQSEITVPIEWILLAQESVYVTYFQSLLGTADTADLILTPRELLFFISLAPQIDFFKSDINSFIEKFRRENHTVCATSLALTQIEIIALTAFTRGQKIEPPWSNDWLQILNAVVSNLLKIQKTQLARGQRNNLN